MKTVEGARALVTGGAGVVGSNIVDQLVDAGAERVVVLDNFSRGRIENLATALTSGRVEVQRGDVLDRPLVDRLVAEADVIFHQAAIRITQCAEDHRLAHEVLATGTLNVAEAVVAAGGRRLVAASSASVYGQAAEFPTTEAHAPWGNRTLYGAAKLYNEGLLRSFHAMHGLDYVALRYFNVYGPRMDVHGVYTEVLIRWMRRIADGQKPLILGDGMQSMDFIYVDDVARANLLAATAPVADDVFNVASGVETTLLELATTLCQVMGRDLGVEHGPERSVEVRRRLADTTKAREVLGFSARVPLDEGLRRLVAWWSEEAGVAA